MLGIADSSSVYMFLSLAHEVVVTLLAEFSRGLSSQEILRKIFFL